MNFITHATMYKGIVIKKEMGIRITNKIQKRYQIFIELLLYLMNSSWP